MGREINHRRARQQPDEWPDGNQHDFSAALDDDATSSSGHPSLPPSKRRRIDEEMRDTTTQGQQHPPSIPISSHFRGQGLSQSGNGSMNISNVYITGPDSIRPSPSSNSAGYRILASSGVDKGQAKENLIDSLYFEHIDARLINLRKAQTKTCEWVLKTEEYLRCMRNNTGDFLWIKGKPGTGKSILMKFLHTRAERSAKLDPSQIVLSFFFNARGEKLEKTTIGLYRSLLWQLLVEAKDLQRDLLDGLRPSTYKLIETSDWNLGTLKEVMETAVGNLGGQTLQLFIDALDECGTSDIADMLDFLEELAEHAKERDVCLRICFSSRHYPEIIVPFGEEIVLENRQEHNADIQRYITSKLKVTRSRSTDNFKKALLEKSSGIFLWVALVIDMLNKDEFRGEPEKMHERLKSIPPDLNQLFQLILIRDQDQMGYLEACIQWVLFAKRPLRLVEYYFALRSSGHRLEGDISDETMCRFVHSSSKGLAGVIKTTSKDKAPSVQFIHESVRDFLLIKEEYRGLPSWSKLEGGFAKHGHQYLSDRCLDEICDSVSHITPGTDEPDNADTKSNSPTDDEASPSASAQIMSGKKPLQVFETRPVLQYAVESILFHTNAAQGNDSTLDTFMTRFPLDSWVHLSNNLERYKIRHHTKKANLVNFCSESDLIWLLSYALRQGSDISIESGRHRYPIFAAIACANDKALNSLLNGIAMLPALEIAVLRSFRQHRGGQLPLAFAVEKGTPLAIDLLLKAGFNADMPDFRSHVGLPKSAFVLAARAGDEGIIRKLLGRAKFEVDPGRRIQRAALRAAVENKHWAVAHLLLEKWCIEFSGDEVLFWAAASGDEVLCERLLTTEILDPDSAFKGFGSPHHLDRIMIDRRDDCGRSPLWHASRYNCRRLLDTGVVDVNWRDRYGASPLWIASRNGHIEVVKLLLEMPKIDVNLVDQYCESPLLAASRNGHTDVVKLLLEMPKIDVNLEHQSGESPLLAASRNGHTEVMKLLLEMPKIDVNLVDQFSRFAASGRIRQ